MNTSLPSRASVTNSPLDTVTTTLYIHIPNPRNQSHAPRNRQEVHADLSAGIVSSWEEAKIRSVLTWVFARGGHVTRMDVARDDRAALVSIAQVKQAVDAGQGVTRSQKFQVLAGSSLRDGTSTGDTLYFGSRESQTMLRVYDKRLELEQKGRAEAKDYGVRWELEMKQDRAQACAKALLTLEPDDWREFLVDVLPPMSIPARPPATRNPGRSTGPRCSRGGPR